MTETITAKELLAKIERRYFKGAGLVKASTLEGDERRAFVLEQVERLLTTEYGATSMAMWLSDEFWIAGEGRMPMYEGNPLLSLKEQQTLTDKEMERLRIILKIAGLCHEREGRGGCDEGGGTSGREGGDSEGGRAECEGGKVNESAKP